ncbi:MAG TPA: hypothetical protein VD788_09580 [Candidatus Polarisedimenticolaceae bacterium]|nr:hypothetical protein [Candidatus Polarisedimenticolaceae bacterium]
MSRTRRRGATGRFVTTEWSLVVASAEGGAAAGEALAELCRIYWPPVYAHLRRRGADPERALDLTQGFFTKLLEKNYIADARRERGRFRTFLLTSLHHYTANEWDRDHALKRGGNRSPIPIDAADAERGYLFEPSHDETPERVFDRRWARTLLRTVLDRLRGDSKEREASGFDRIAPFVVGGQESGYRAIAGELGTTEAAVRVRVHRLRRRFRALVREEVARTVVDERQIELEMRHLFRVLAG